MPFRTPPFSALLLVLAFAATLLPLGRALADDAATSQAQATSLLKLARETLGLPDAPEVAEQQDLTTPSVVFLSLSRTARPAVIGIGVADTVEDATRLAAGDLRSKATFGDLSNGRLRIDFVADAQLPPTDQQSAPLRVLPSPVGLMFVHGDWLFVPQDPAQIPTKAPAVTFASWIETEAGPIELYEGSALVQDTSPEHLLAACTAGGDYLLRGLRLDGKFDYLFDAAKGESVNDENLVRNAGTCYGLARLQQALNTESPGQPPADQRYLNGALRGLAYLLDNHSSGPRDDQQHLDFTTIVTLDEVSELGGTALTLLALLKCHEVSGDESMLPLLTRMGNFIVYQQDPNGHFRSYYFFRSTNQVQEDSIYYPGESILALSRLARVDPQGPWLEAAKKGADYLIDVRDAGIPADELYHDHWLLMSLNELSDLTGDPRYVAAAEKLGTSICNLQLKESPRLDWIGTYYMPPRSTPAACRGEALVGMIEIARRNKLDDTRYLETLQRSAAFQLRFQITPENGIYLPRPDLALGGFRGSYEDWLIQIDFVQHNISALLGYRALQLSGKED